MGNKKNRTCFGGVALKTVCPTCRFFRQTLTAANASCICFLRASLCLLYAISMNIKNIPATIPPATSMNTPERSRKVNPKETPGQRLHQAFSLSGVRWVGGFPARRSDLAQASRSTVPAQDSRRCLGLGCCSEWQDGSIPGNASRVERGFGFQRFSFLLIGMEANSRNGLLRCERH